MPSGCADVHPSACACANVCASPRFRFLGRAPGCGLAGSRGDCGPFRGWSAAIRTPRLRGTSPQGPPPRGLQAPAAACAWHPRAWGAIPMGVSGQPRGDQEETGSRVLGDREAGARRGPVASLCEQRCFGSSGGKKVIFRETFPDVPCSTEAKLAAPDKGPPPTCADKGHLVCPPSSGEPVASADVPSEGWERGRYLQPLQGGLLGAVGAA